MAASKNRSAKRSGWAAAFAGRPDLGFVILIASVLLAACAPAAPTATPTPITPTPRPFATSNYAAIPTYTPGAGFGIGPITDDISFPSGDITLVGRLELPKGSGPFPAIIWVHGSGKSTRHEADGLASILVHAGYAVFRYDKRGVGESGGFYSGVQAANSEHILGQLAKDAAAAADFLATQDHIDAEHIGLFGASQAGWIIPQAAALSDNINFFALISGPAISVGIENYYSGLTRDEEGGVTLEEAERFSDRLANFTLSTGFDPQEAIAALDIPALWVLGGRDASQPTRETVAVLEAIRLHNPNITIFVYPEANHGLFDVTHGRRVPYMDEVILPWIYAASHP